MMLHENIRNIRKEKCMTQESLAEAMGVTTAAVSKWETGQSAPEVPMLMELADFFEVSVDTLLSHTVSADRKQSLLERMKKAAEEDCFEDAKRIARTVLRSYPNDFSVVDQVADLYYHIFIRIHDNASMEYAIELVQRLFKLADDPSGKMRYELFSRLGNMYELLDDWEKAREYHEKGNVAGNNERTLAYALAQEGKSREALDRLSKVFMTNLFYLMVDANRIKELWEQQEQPEKAKAALQWAVSAMDNLGPEMLENLRILAASFALNLAGMEENKYEEHLRRAVQLLSGATNAQGLCFVTEMPKQVYSSILDSPEKLLAVMSAPGLESWAAIVRDEMSKLQAGLTTNM